MQVPSKGWRNKGGTGERSCECGSWANHWLKFSGKPWPTLCSVANCISMATLGAHVTNAAFDQREYIVPMCAGCNSRFDDFELAGTTIVPANKAETCEKACK